MTVESYGDESIYFVYLTHDRIRNNHGEPHFLGCFTDPSECLEFLCGGEDYPGAINTYTWAGEEYGYTPVFTLINV